MTSLNGNLFIVRNGSLYRVYLHDGSITLLGGAGGWSGADFTGW